MKRVANVEVDRLRQLTAALRHNLELCAKDATVDAVHDVRTGTRRIEAMLDTIIRERVPLDIREDVPPAPDPQPDNVAALQQTAQRWLRLLKRIRRAAAPVRDLDVHRELLANLLPLEEKRPPGPGSIPGTSSLSSPPRSENGSGDEQAANANLSLMADPASLASTSPVEQQAEDLDAWLEHQRQDHAQPLMKAAPKWASRLDAQLALLEEAMRQGPSRRRASRSAAVTALEAFARLTNQMQQLDAGNLHDFRKGAKKARYMTESGGADEHAGVVGRALKRLQDEIGDWHDWLVLAEEAHHALGSQGAELIALIETQRDQHYARAMHITERMRGRLMGEWQALSARPRARTRPPRPADSSVS